uniref:Uncharacterized protein n=1 Tax=Oryza punctata TaxID=4537 RepID=A0A0E0JKC9_ORYPU
MNYTAHHHQTHASAFLGAPPVFPPPLAPPAFLSTAVADADADADADRRRRPPREREVQARIDPELAALAWIAL